jgi:hypothetical protein
MTEKRMDAESLSFGTWASNGWAYDDAAERSRSENSRAPEECAARVRIRARYFYPAYHGLFASAGATPRPASVACEALVYPLAVCMIK